MKSVLLWALLVLSASAQVVPSSGSPTSQIVGQIQTATGGTINNGTLTFTLSQPAIIAGSASLATQTTACYTSNQGNVVGTPDPLPLPILSVNTGSGTLPAGTYFVKIYYTTTNGTVSAVSPEASVILSSQGTVIVNPPVLQPSSASGFGVAISTSSGAETIQGTVLGFVAQFQQSVPLVVGAAPLATNNTTCNIYFSDQLVPTGTYYTVGLKNKNATPVAGFPQTWCTYGGGGATINVSQGAPTGNCNVSGVFYPTPIFSNLANNASQSINTPLTLPGPVTFSGNNNFSATNSFAGPTNLSGVNIFNGSTTAANLNAVYNPATCANSPAPTWCSGLEMGAWTNAAYAACPAGGCRIHIPGQAACYSFTTPIVLSTSNKPALLEGDPGATCLKYTPTTGTAITLDYGQASTGAGIRDIQLIGPGSGTTAIGVSLAPTNGAIMSRISGFRIGSNFGLTDGFGTGFQFGPLGFVTQITNSVFGNSGTGMTVAGGGIENLAISDSIFDHNTTGLIYNAANLDIHISKTSFDDNTTGISVGNGGSNPEPSVTCEGCHFENAGLGAGASAYVSANGGTFTCTNCEFLDDRSSSSSTQMITASGASFISLLGTTVFSNGITISEVVNFSGTSRGILQTVNSSVAITSTFNTAYTGAPVLDLSTWASAATPITAKNTGFSGNYSSYPELASNPGVQAAGLEACYGDQTNHALKCSYNNSIYFNQAQTIGSGTATSAGTVINAGTSQTLAITITNATTTDVATCATNAAYPATWQTGIQVLPPVVTSNTVTLTFSNPTAGNITPVAQTFRCSVIR